MRLRLNQSIMLGVGCLLLPWHVQLSHPFTQPPAHAAHTVKPQHSIPPTQHVELNFTQIGCRFNCTLRAQLNTLENLPIFLAVSRPALVMAANAVVQILGCGLQSAWGCAQSPVPKNFLGSSSMLASQPGSGDKSSCDHAAHPMLLAFCTWAGVCTGSCLCQPQAFLNS